MLPAHQISRRRFIVGAATGGAGAVASATIAGRLLSGGHPGKGALPDPSRVLVVIEMAGGNDGLSMVIPYADPAYTAHRRRTAVDAASVLQLDKRLGLHPALSRLHRRGVSAVVGVGSPSPDLSHFEMLRRWWAGTSQSGDPFPGTGVLGRVCDQLGNPSSAPLVGVSVGLGAAPIMESLRAPTASLAYSGGGFPSFDDPGMARLWMAAHRAMAHPDRSEAALLQTARRGEAGAIRVAELVDSLPAATPGYPDTDLGAQLAFAGRLIRGRSGVRVIHVPMSADFDTHDNHPARAAANMTLLDGALGAFLDDLERAGALSSTLVMTFSEFGRRVDDNGDSGLDHGAASMMLMAGGVRPGVHGEMPSLDRLDDDGNLRPTVSNEEYLATGIEGWLGVPADSVLQGHPRPLRSAVMAAA